MSKRGKVIDATVESSVLGVDCFEVDLEGSSEWLLAREERMVNPVLVMERPYCRRLVYDCCSLISLN